MLPRDSGAASLSGTQWNSIAGAVGEGTAGWQAGRGDQFPRAPSFRYFETPKRRKPAGAGFLYVLPTT